MAEALTLTEQFALPQALLKDLPLERSGRHAVAADGVSVRAFPFPYRSGLAVSNDCDSQSIDCMRDWHAFVNGTKPTGYGDGLGLEVGDSFWVYGGSVEPALFKGNPFDESHRDGYALGEIVELGRLGWFDTLHSFGNWSARLIPPERVDDPTVYSRDQIRKGLDRMEELGVRPFVFVNHSGSPSNIGGPWGWYQKADDPTHGLHSLDLMTEFGFRYFWLDSCTQLDKFGENLDFGDEWDLHRALDRFRWFHWLRQVDAERKPHPIALPESDEERRDLLVSIFNRQIFPVPAQDGSTILAFKRYRDIDQPVGATFPAQVTAAKLDMLEERRGNVIVYQHFGVFGPRGRSPTVSRPHRSRSPIPALDEHSVATWRMIAERSREGRLFVATVGRLLDWIWLREAMRLSVDKSQERWVVTLEGIDCKVRGARDLEERDLNGLALTVPASAPEVQVIVARRATPLSMQRAADPATPGLDAIYLDWEELEWPE